MESTLALIKGIVGIFLVIWTFIGMAVLTAWAFEWAKQYVESQVLVLLILLAIFLVSVASKPPDARETRNLGHSSKITLSEE